MDAIATPFVHGRLTDRPGTYKIRSQCAQSGSEIEFELDSDLKLTQLDDDADPIFCMSPLRLANIKAPSIVDIF